MLWQWWRRGSWPRSEYGFDLQANAPGIEHPLSIVRPASYFAIPFPHIHPPRSSPDFHATLVVVVAAPMVFMLKTDSQVASCTQRSVGGGGRSGRGCRCNPPRPHAVDVFPAQPHSRKT